MASEQGQNVRWYQQVVSAGATVALSSVVYNNGERVFVAVSGVTAFNAGAGNTRILLTGKFPQSTTWSDFPGASALTEVASSRVYDFGICPPFESIQLQVGTATTQVATFYVGLLG